MTRADLKSESIHVSLFNNIYKITNYNFNLLLPNETLVLYCNSLTISCTGFPTFANASAGRHEKLRNITLTMNFTFVFSLNIIVNISFDVLDFNLMGNETKNPKQNLVR